MKSLLIACAALATMTAAGPVAAARSIVYKGSDKLAGYDITYTIKSNGTIGRLTVTDILSSAITFTGSDAFSAASRSLTGTNTLYFSDRSTEGPGLVTASGKHLKFDFAGAGGLNFCDDTYVACYAFAPAQATDDDSIVYHGDTPLPVKEVDNVQLSYSLQPNTYTSVAATSQVFGTAVPEPAAWAMLLAGFGIVGTMMRIRVRDTVAA